jgi:hypothetical protein
VTATEIGAGGDQAPKSARVLSAMAMNVKRRGFAQFGAVGYWLYGAFGCAALAVASLVAIWIPSLASVTGSRFYALAAIAAAGALFCALLAVARRIGDLVEATTALKDAQDVSARESAAPSLRDPETLLETSLERSLEAQIAGSIATDFADSQLAQNSERLAAALEMASRGIGAHGEAMRDRLQGTADEMIAAMSSHTQVFADRLSEERAKAAEALELYSESITSRLNLASVSLTREYRDSAEQLRLSLENSGDAAAKVLTRRGQMMAESLKASASEIDRGLLERSQAFLSDAEATTRSTSETLARESEAAAQRLSTGAGLLSEQVSTASAAIERSLSDAKDLIGRLVEDALGQIEKRIAAQIEALGSRLTTVEQEVEQSWANRREKLGIDIAAESEALRNALAAGATAASRRAAEDVEQLAKSTTQLLQSAAEQIGSAVASGNAAFAERIADIESALNGRGEALIGKLDAQSSGLRAALEKAETVVSERGDGLVEAIDRIARELNQTVAEKVSDFGSRAVAMRESFDGAMQAHALALSERAEAGQVRLADLADRHGASVTQALSAHQVAADGAIAAAIAELQSEAVNREQAAAARLHGVAREFVDDLVGRMGGLTEALGSRGEELRSQFVARQTELVDIIRTGLAQTDERARERLGSISQALEELASRIDNGLESRGKAIVQTLARATLEITQGLANSSKDLTTAIDAGAAEAVKALADQGSTAREMLASGAHDAAQILEAGREQFVSSLALSAKEAVEGLTSRGREAREALAAETSEAVARLEASRSTVSGAASAAALTLAEEFARHNEQLAKTVGAGVERMNREFGAPLGETIARVQAEGAELSSATRALAETIGKTASVHRESLKEGFDREAQALAAALATNAETFRRDFQAALTGADEVFLGRSLELAGELSNRIAELRLLLDKDGRAFIEGFETHGAQWTSQVESISQRSLNDFERKAAGLISLLTRRGDDLLSAMTAAASESARKVAALSGEVDTGTDRTAASLRQIERKFAALLSMIDKRSDDLTVGHTSPHSDGAASEPPAAHAPASDQADAPPSA